MSALSAARGLDYVAVRRISDRENRTLAAVGETCERVPTDALPWLLDGGDIRPVTAEEAARQLPTRRGNRAATAGKE